MPADDLHIRLLREADLPDYKQLRDLMLARHPAVFTSDAETEQQRAADSYRGRLGLSHGGGTSSHSLFTLAAWQGTRLVGALSCEREPRAKVRHIAHLVGMMVLDELHGQGIGRQLLDESLARLKLESGLMRATLTVSNSNATAIRLYERVGFSRYGRLEGALRLADGRLLDKDLMSRPL